MAEIPKKAEPKAAVQASADDQAVIENLELLMNFETLQTVDNWGELLYLADVPDAEAEAAADVVTEETK